MKKIESHPHRQALHADLQQINFCNPFSDESKSMIRESGNAELFELCETTPKVQCSQCNLNWNQGVIYCTCGDFKKVRLHGDRHGKTEAQKQYHIAWNAWKRCFKKVTSKELMIVFSETKYVVNCKSKLAGPSRSPSIWTNSHRKTTRTVYPKRNSRESYANGVLS